MVMSMLESVSDLVSLIVMIVSVLAGIYYVVKSQKNKPAK